MTPGYEVAGSPTAIVAQAGAMRTRGPGFVKAARALEAYPGQLQTAQDKAGCYVLKEAP